MIKILIVNINIFEGFNKINYFLKIKIKSYSFVQYVV